MLFARGTGLCPLDFKHCLTTFLEGPVLHYKFMTQPLLLSQSNWLYDRGVGVIQHRMHLIPTATYSPDPVSASATGCCATSVTATHCVASSSMVLVVHAVC